MATQRATTKQVPLTMKPLTRTTSVFLLALALHVLLVLQTSLLVQAQLRGQDGSLSLLLATQATNSNSSSASFWQFAAAMLAVDHFNTRNGTIVKQVETRCEEIQFGSVQVVDASRSPTGGVLQSVLGSPSSPLRVPNAIVGPGTEEEEEEEETHVLAKGLQIPLVAPIGSHLLQQSPFVTSMSADPNSQMEFVVQYLQHTQRNNYIVILYANKESCIQKANRLKLLLMQQQQQGQGQDQFTHIQTFAYYYNPQQQSNPQSVLAQLQIPTVLEKVQNTGYPTIVLLSNDISNDANEIAVAATRLGLDPKRHFWIVTAEDVVTTRSFAFSSFWNGAAYLLPYDGSKDSSFWELQYQSSSQDGAFLARLNALFPNPNNNHNKYSNQQPFVPTTAPLQNLITTNSGFWYDAVMTIGLGACHALRSNHNITGTQHQDGIRAVEFVGASGTVQFEKGARVANTVSFLVANLVSSTTIDHNDEDDDNEPQR